MRLVNLNIGKTKLLPPFTYCGWTAAVFQLLVVLPRQNHSCDSFAKGFSKVILVKLYVQWFSFNFEFKYTI